MSFRYTTAHAHVCLVVLFRRYRDRVCVANTQRISVDLITGIIMLLLCRLIFSKQIDWMYEDDPMNYLLHKSDATLRVRCRDRGNHVFLISIVVVFGVFFFFVFLFSRLPEKHLFSFISTPCEGCGFCCFEWFGSLPPRHDILF